jgi:hypothetical protein
VAKAAGVFAGFAAGRIVEEKLIEETPDSNRFGYVSDVCVLSAFFDPPHRRPLPQGAGSSFES